MDSRVLEYFLRVADLNSISRASAELNLSQSALSRHISSLEHELGVQLFLRTSGGVQLTDAGALFTDQVRPILKQLSRLVGHVGERSSGHLALGVPPSWQSLVTSNVAERIVSDYPAVSLRVYEGIANTLRDHLVNGLLDLAILPFNSANATGYCQTPIVREPHLLVGPKSANLSTNVPVAITELDGIKLALPGRPNILRAHLENAFSRANISFKIVMESDTLGLCMDLVKRQLCYTVMPACMLYNDSIRDSFSMAPLKGMFSTWALYEHEARSNFFAVRAGKQLILDAIDVRLAEKKWIGAEKPMV